MCERWPCNPTTRSNMFCHCSFQLDPMPVLKTNNFRPHARRCFFFIFFKDMRHFTFQEGLLWFILVVSSLVQCQFSRQIISDPMPEDVFFNILQGHEAFYFSRGSTMVYPCSFQLGPMPVPQQYNFRPHARRFFLIFFKDMRHFTFQEGLLWFILVVSNLVQCQFPSNIISDPM